MLFLCALVSSSHLEHVAGEREARPVSRGHHVVSVEPDARVVSLAETRATHGVLAAEATKPEKDEATKPEKDEATKPEKDEATKPEKGATKPEKGATKPEKEDAHGKHEKHGEHGKHGEHEHDHDAHLKEPPHREGVAVSATLFAVWSLVMTFYFLGNSSDPDIKAHTWQVVAVTFSIFCSVLMFSMTTRLVNKVTGHCIYMMFVVAFVWLALLQVIVWKLANTESKTDERSKDLDSRELNVKAFVGTLAHIAGFAFTFAFAELQQEWKNYTWAVVPLAIGSWTIIFVVCGAYRHKVIHADGKVTAEEELWEEECDESEHEAAGLCISFVLVQSIREVIEGGLPNAEGNGGQKLMKSGGKAGTMLAMALAFTISICVVVVAQYRLSKAHRKEGEHGHGHGGLSHRLLDTVKETTTFATAWCFVFGIQSWLSQLTAEDDESTILRTVLAFVCSYAALGVTQFLDILDDYSTLKQWSVRFEIRHSVFAIMGALGMLIGFTWERVFDEAVVDVSKACGRIFSGGTLSTQWDTTIELYSRIFDVLINTVLFAVSIVAFRWYICPVCVRTRKVADEEKKKALGADV